MQHLDGDQAVAYMRFRHDWCSDPCRIMRQQQVLRAMVDKLKSDRVNTLLHLGDLLAVFRKYVQTDFTNSELLSLATYFQGMPPDRPSSAIKFRTPTTSICRGYGDSLVPDTTRARSSSRRCCVAPPAPVPSPDAMALAAIPPCDAAR